MLTARRSVLREAEIDAPRQATGSRSASVYLRNLPRAHNLRPPKYWSGVSGRSCPSRSSRRRAGFQRKQSGPQLVPNGRVPAGCEEEWSWPCLCRGSSDGRWSDNDRSVRYAGYGSFSTAAAHRRRPGLLAPARPTVLVDTAARLRDKLPPANPPSGERRRPCGVQAVNPLRLECRGPVRQSQRN